MDSRVLRVNYNGNVAEVVVDDTDKSLLIDVINDVCAEFAKMGYDLPEFPGFQYVCGDELVPLVDDQSLMNMYLVMREAEIDVLVVELHEPCLCWKLAMQVKGVNITNPGPSRQKLPVRKSARLTPQPLSPQTQTSPVVNSSCTTRKLPALLEELSFSPPHISASHEPFDFEEPVPISLEEFEAYTQTTQTQSGPFISTNNTHASTPILSASFGPPPKNTKNINDATNCSPKPKKPKRPPIFSHGKKMSKRHQMNKGLWVPVKERNLVPVPETSNTAIVRSRFRPRQQSEAVVDELDISDDYDSDTEGEYVPIESDSESDDEQGHLEDEGNLILALKENFCDGGWEPFNRREEVYENDGGYLTKMYNNGVVYEDADLGKIRLRTWQLFVDKDHFKDVLRDYCVQEGFSLVVLTADNERYTAECADIRCEWRIHASRLADEHHWSGQDLSHSYFIGRCQKSSHGQTCYKAAVV